MQRFVSLTIIGAIAVAANQAAAQHQTFWTDAAGNHSWADIANWSAGLPGASSYAVVGSGSGAVDLGGAQREVGTLDIQTSWLQLGNGTLATRTIEYSGYSTTQMPLIAADLTGLGGPLQVFTTHPSFGIQIDGSIKGAMDFYLWGAARVTAPATYSGTTYLLPGRLQLQDDATILSSSGFHVGGQLYLSNVAMPLSNRIRDDVPFQFAGGSMVFHNTALPIEERVGPMHLSSGGGLTMVGQSVLRSASLTRERGSIFATNADPAAGRRIIFDTAPALVGAGTTATSRGILPFAGQVTYDLGPDGIVSSDDLGIRPLNATEYQTAMPAAGSTDPAPNVVLSGTHTISGVVAVNSVSGGAISLDNAELHVESGYLDSMVSGTGTIVAPDELFMSIDRTTLNVPIKAKSVVIQGGWPQFSAANEIAEQLVIQSEQMTVRDPAAFGTAKVTLTSPLVEWRTPLSIEIPNDIQFGQSDRPDLGPNRYVQWQNVNVTTYGRTLTFGGTLTGKNIWLSGGGGHLKINGNVETGWFVVNGFDLIEINGTVNSPAMANGMHNNSIVGNLCGNGDFRGMYGHGEVSPGAPGLTGRLQVEMLMDEVLYHCDLDSPSSFDQLVIKWCYPSLLSVAPVLQLDLTFAPELGQQFLIVDNQGSDFYPGMFQGYAEGALIDGGLGKFQITYYGGNGNDIVLTTVPEPAVTGVALAAALVYLARRRTRSV